MDVSEIKSRLLIYGDLKGNCAHCNQFDLKLDDEKCPQCGTTFDFIAFRNIRSHIPKMHKLLESRPDIKFIDYEDYKRNIGVSKAKDFLK